MERRLAVIDLGSNSFRLVVFTHTDDWWKRTDEIYEPVRVGEHQEAGGPLQPEPMERALETIELFAHFTRATASSASGRSPRRRSARRRTAPSSYGRRARAPGWTSRCCRARRRPATATSPSVNSTTLRDGVALDIGGGSMQLTHVADRRARDARSWRLGAV